MYKTDVSYEDFNGNHKEETLYFNLNKPEMIKLLKERPTLQDELSELANRLSKKDADNSLYVDFISFVDDLIRLSYGIKTDSGNFRKSSDIVDEFTSSNAYEALFTKFLNNPKEYDSFIAGIFPADVMTEEVKAQALKQAEELANK